MVEAVDWFAPVVALEADPVEPWVEHGDAAFPAFERATAAAAEDGEEPGVPPPDAPTNGSEAALLPALSWPVAAAALPCCVSVMIGLLATGDNTVWLSRLPQAELTAAAQTRGRRRKRIARRLRVDVPGAAAMLNLSLVGE